MLVILQFPLTDIRCFLDIETGKLLRPNWFSANPDVDFVRSFGHIRFRPRGGLTGWVGENVICEANRALRFDSLNSFKDKTTGKSIQPEIAFRRFYSDGLAMGKFEIGFRFKLSKSKKISKDLMKNLLHYILQLPVVVPNKTEKVKTVLCDAGKALGKLYLESTTNASNVEKINNSWIKFGKPLIIVLHNGQEREDLPFWGRRVIIPSNDGINLRYYLFSNDDKSYPVWTVEEKHLDSQNRHLRIYLSRLYAEQETLKRVLESIANGDIELQLGSIASSELQKYLNSATHQIIKMESKTDRLSNNAISTLARNAVDLLIPGEKEKIVNALSSLKIRLNVLRKTEEFIDRLSYREYYKHFQFSQLHNVRDKDLRSSIVRALNNITLSNVDLGLFDLGKLLENELKLLLEAYKSFSGFEINKKEFSNMKNMIDVLEQIDASINKNDIHFLRLERNKRAHGEIPPESVRRELLLHSPFIVDLYVKYIALFFERRIAISKRE